jgi:hypothetical protein
VQKNSRRLNKKKNFYKKRKGSFLEKESALCRFFLGIKKNKKKFETRQEICNIFINFEGDFWH